VRVALDVTNFAVGLAGGTPVFLYNLVRELPACDPALELVLLYNQREGRGGEAVLEALRGPRVEVRRITPAEHRLPYAGWWYPLHPTPRALAGEIDLFHAGDFLRPRPDGTPIVASVLDLTARIHPEHHEWKNRWRDAMKLRWVRRAADRVLAISEATRRDVVEHLGIAAERVDVAPLARGLDEIDAAARVDVRALRARLGVGGAPFVLCVGTLEPRKNQLRLVHAFEALAADFPDLHLVLVGGPGWKYGPIERAIEASPVAARIHRTGFLPAAELREAYRQALAFAYPSLYEGFGLPILEAMAAGTPVLTSAVSSMPEVAGDAALLVEPDSTEAIRDGLARLLREPALRAELVRRGYEREASFTWRRCAEATLAAYRRTLAAR
jgi:alpha-1,3-rhamnosyl/mannosyltransferase